MVLSSLPFVRASSLGCLGADRDHLGAGAELVTVVGPKLQHLPALIQVERLVIDATDCAIAVGELHLDPVAVPVQLVQDRAGGLPEAVGRCDPAIAQAVEGAQKAVLAEPSDITTVAVGENVGCSAVVTR